MKKRLRLSKDTLRNLGQVRGGTAPGTASDISECPTYPCSGNGECTGTTTAGFACGPSFRQCPESNGAYTACNICTYLR